MRGGAAWWVAPTYPISAVGWRQIKGLFRQVPRAVIHETTHKADLPGGGWCQVRSADEPDSLRGEGLNRVVMDECAFIAEAAWSEAIRPSLADRKGDALFISTPKGQNWFWRLWTKGQEASDPEWKSWRFPSGSNPFLDAAEIEAARGDLPERVFRQEFLAEFIDEAGGVFRNVNAAVDQGRIRPDVPIPGNSYAIGVDLARVQDFTVITVLDGNRRQVYHERFNQISWERQIAAIKAVYDRYPGAIVLDATGVGDPIWEALRATGAKVAGYHFTSNSKEKLINRLAMDIEQGTLRLMDLPTQTNELLAYQYELTPSRNVRMNAPDGMHDDCVISLALANWGVNRYAYIEEKPADDKRSKRDQERYHDVEIDTENEDIWT